jgi:hypothetical protein
VIATLSAGLGFIYGAVLLPGAFFVARRATGWLLRVGPASLRRLTVVLPGSVCILAIIAGYAFSARAVKLLAQGDASLQGTLGRTLVRWSIVGLGAFLTVSVLKTRFLRGGETPKE